MTEEERQRLLNFDFDKLSPERKEDFRAFMDASSIKSPIRLIDSYFSHQEKIQATNRLTHKSLIESEIMKRALMSTPQKDTKLSLIKNPDISGVIFTKDKTTNSHYYEINYDTSKKTDLITSGKYNPSIKSLTIYKKNKFQQKYIKPSHKNKFIFDLKI